jgi:hypothetical protein
MGSQLWLECLLPYMPAAKSRLVALPDMWVLASTAHKQSWYMLKTLGASVTVPAPSSPTRTPMKPTSVKHPNGAHPGGRNDPYASVSRIANGILCSAKNRATPLLFVPTLSSTEASRLRVSTWRANVAPRILQRYSLSPNKPTPAITTIRATVILCRFKKFTTPVSGHSRYPCKLPAKNGHPVSQLPISRVTGQVRHLW